MRREKLIVDLAGLPGWDSATAYQRTRMACLFLSERKLDVPGWNVLRDLIGKGSPHDIRRAVSDFREELERNLSHAASAIEAPEEVMRLFGDFWLAARKASAVEASEELNSLREQTEWLAATNSDLEAKLAAAEAALRRSQEQLLAERTRRVDDLTALMRRLAPGEDVASVKQDIRAGQVAARSRSMKRSSRKA